VVSKLNKDDLKKETWLADKTGLLINLQKAISSEEISEK